MKDRNRGAMVGQTWLVLSLGICLCEFPCSAQRRSPFVSHGSFVRGPTITHMKGGVQFRPGGGYGTFARPHPPYGFRAFQPMRPMPSFRGWSEFSSRADNEAPGSSFTRGPHRFSESNAARQFSSVSEAPSPFADERAMESSPPMASARAIQPTTKRTDRFVPRPPPSRIAGTTSIVPRPPFGSRSMSPLVPRPPLRSAAVDGNSHFGNSHFGNIPQLVAPRPKILLSSRSFSPFLSNRFFSSRPFLFSPLFSNTSLLSQPRFFSPLFSSPFFFQQPFFFSPLFSNGFYFSLTFFNPFFFQRPLLASPFFFNSFFFQPTFFFSSGFFFSLSFANQFFFQPLFFSPLFSSPFFFQQPLFFSPFFSNGFFVIRRSSHFDI